MSAMLEIQVVSSLELFASSCMYKMSACFGGKRLIYCVTFMGYSTVCKFTKMGTNLQHSRDNLNSDK